MKRGFGFIEIIIGGAILSTAFIGISAYYQRALKVSRITAHTVQASLLLEEGLEVARFFRDSGWSNVYAPPTGTSYYLSFDGTKWATSTTNVYVDGVFERTVRFDDVYRDALNDIVTTGGTIDLGTRSATVTVSWREETSTTTKSIQIYLSNILT